MSFQRSWSSELLSFQRSWSSELLSFQRSWSSELLSFQRSSELLSFQRSWSSELLSFQRSWSSELSPLCHDNKKETSSVEDRESVLKDLLSDKTSHKLRSPASVLWVWPDSLSTDGSVCSMGGSEVTERHSSSCSVSGRVFEKRVRKRKEEEGGGLAVGGAYSMTMQRGRCWE
ncbi:hypothetical protein EYF80_054604 [Liparis tanakae]|uniref:Uncharacterized protein n=1 Tax=Liparis tanakae TaxID=230148 RepID=A0A4Z2F2E8_9TELE|nr:hypothetical protein EYF80_054604 [Liparis tanakae]